MENGVPHVRASSELQFGVLREVAVVVVVVVVVVPFGRWWHARGRGNCRGEPGSALSSGYAPDSATAEGSSIVDEPAKY